jgi:lysophospholipase L1-like esterase
MKIIAIGDSCTYGQGVRASEAWPAVLERLTGHDVRNAGVCGDTTRLGLERFPRDVQLHRPDAVIVQFGLNDANRWESDLGPERVSDTAYVANIHDLFSRILAIGAIAIVLRPHQPDTPDRAYNERVTLYAIMLRDSSTLGVDDFGHCAPLVSVLADGYGVHPDVAMHERYAQLVAEAL